MFSESGSSVLDHAAQTFEREGYYIARGLISPQEAANIRDVFTQFGQNGPVEGISEIKRPKGLAGQQAYTASDPLAKFPRMMQPHRHPELPVGPVAQRYLLDPRIGQVLRRLLNDEPIAAQTMFYFKPPKARGQDFHQDNFYLRVKPGTCIAAWIAIDDVDPENGGMMVVPGTQNMEIVCPETNNDSSKFFTDHHVPFPDGLQPVPAVMKAGDVLFFNGSLIHGSYPNTSADRFRRSLICHYVPAGCAEVALAYRPLLNFQGNEVFRDQAQGGGPCGAPLESLH